MNKKIRIIIIILIAILLAISFAIYAFQKEFKREKLPEINNILPFKLTDSEGKVFSYTELRGKVWIASFFFTTCGDVCPVMSENLAALHRTFNQVQNVHIVSFSVNPEVDTPDMLKNYAKKYKANTESWHFLTGERALIKDIALNSFKLGSIEEPVFHSTYFTLVDRNGFIRGYYDGMDKNARNKLFKDAVNLLNERF